VLGAVYMLWMYQRVMFGELDESANGDLEDMRSGELVTLLPVLALIFVMGVYPRPFLDTMKTSVEVTLARASGSSTLMISGAGVHAIADASGSGGACGSSTDASPIAACGASGGHH